MSQPRTRKSKQAELPAVNADAVAAQDVEFGPVEHAAPPEQDKPPEQAAPIEQAAPTERIIETDKGAGIMNAEANMDAQTASVQAATVANESLVSDVKAVRQELASQMNWVFGAICIAGVALVVAMTAPMWSARIVANDAQTVRTLALASAYLGRVTETSRPFTNELALVRHALPNDAKVKAIVEAIAPLAGTSAPTVAELTTKLDSMASDVFVGKVVGNDTWVNSSVTRLASFARIESLATTVAPRYTGDEVALVHEAETSMAKGDLKQAVAKLEKLTGHAGETAASWLGMAKQRLLLNEKVAELSALALARTSQPARFVLP
ncbi:MAG: hypothetical protein H7840_15135 [Alphaproteobacteria bacterium]